MNPAELPNTLSLDELQNKVLDYKDNFEVFQKEKEQFELQKKTNLFDEKAQKEMELQIETQRKKLEIMSSDTLTSLDTLLLKQDIDNNQKAKIEQLKKEVNDRDPNSSGGVRESITKFVYDTRSTTGGKIARIGGSILTFFGLKSLFSKKKKEKDKSDEDNQQNQTEDQEGEDNSQTDDEPNTSQDDNQDENKENKKDGSEEEKEKIEDEDPIDELNNQVDKVTKKAGKTIDLFEKVGDWINKKAA